jgi:predicted transcriptional regulator
MTKTVVSVLPTATVTQTASTMTNRGFTALPVVNDAGELIGIVTEADVIRNRYPDNPSEPVRETAGDVMTSPVVGVNHDADVSIIARAMLTTQRRCMPIVDGSTLVGVVTRGDIVRALARTDADIAADIRRNLRVLGEQSRWTVQVSNGDVAITDMFHDASDRAVVQVLAEAVPGVIRASIAQEPRTHAGGT